MGLGQPDKLMDSLDFDQVTQNKERKIRLKNAKDKKKLKVI